MNYVSCIVRLLEIPDIKLYQNTIPLIQFNVEIGQVQHHQHGIILKAKIWGDLTYTLTKYYCINDYLLVEGYILNDVLKNSNSKNSLKLNIFHIYPLFA